MNKWHLSLYDSVFLVVMLLAAFAIPIVGAFRESDARYTGIAVVAVVAVGAVIALYRMPSDEETD